MGRDHPDGHRDEGRPGDPPLHRPERGGGDGWTPAQDFTEDFGALPSDEANIETADVTITQDVLDGVPMTRFTVVWDAAEYDPGDEGEGTVTVTHWVDGTGRMHRFEIDGEVMEDGVTTKTRGVFTWEPWDKPVPWPAEIVGHESRQRRPAWPGPMQRRVRLLRGGLPASSFACEQTKQVCLFALASHKKPLLS